MGIVCLFHSSPCIIELIAGFVKVSQTWCMVWQSRAQSPISRNRRSRGQVYEPDGRTGGLISRIQASYGDTSSYRWSDLVSRMYRTIETGLCGYLQFYLQIEFKSLWPDVVAVPGPPWSHRDCLHIFEKHWHSVYRFVL